MNTYENRPPIVPDAESNRHSRMSDEGISSSGAEVVPDASQPGSAHNASDDSSSQPQRENRRANDNGERTNEPAYEVGYRRPPKRTRFKPGVSGNPKGRQRRNWTMKGDLRRQFLEKVPVQVGSKRKRVTKLTLLMNSLINRGIKGDTRAALAAYKLAVELGLLDVKLNFTYDFAQMTPEERKTISQAFATTNPIYEKYKMWPDILRNGE